MNESAGEKQITWEMLNLCIGSIFEVIQSQREFTTGDVANALAAHGVEVTDRPIRAAAEGRN